MIAMDKLSKSLATKSFTITSLGLDGKTQDPRGKVARLKVKTTGKRDWGLGIRDWGLGVKLKNYGGGFNPPPNFKNFPSPQSPVPSTNSGEESPTIHLYIVGDSSPRPVKIQIIFS
ncbi:hypothetical protein NIES4103_20340 [Nostoc sp. NIES-4103]|nr:hypothetical protein NIES4103_20340 [Nostoc sp. NIES-4103]